MNHPHARATSHEIGNPRSQAPRPRSAASCDREPALRPMDAPQMSGARGEPFTPSPERYLETGQRGAFDSEGRPLSPKPGLSQDGAPNRGRRSPQPRFVLGGVGDEVFDRLTGLSWRCELDAFPWPCTWREALEQARSASLNGGWRLPNRRELRSLVSYARRDPALPVTHPFAGVPLGPVWTSTTVAGAPRHAWTVRFDGGRMFFANKQESAFVWLVRGEATDLPRTGQHQVWDDAGQLLSVEDPEAEGQDGAVRTGLPWPSPRFAVGRAWVLDRLTGLGWAHGPMRNEPLTWWQALRDAKHLADRGHGGRQDWRLPTVNELETLVDASASRPALPMDHPFQGIPPTVSCWTSTTSGYERNWAMAVYFEHGAVGVGQKAGAHHQGWAVCGRPLGGQPHDSTTGAT